jgi:hypothetical protein
MRLRAASTVAAAGAGLALAVTFLASRPARAQFTGPAPTLPPVSTGLGSAAAAPAPQPIQIQALDASHFVVATREPRLVQRTHGADGTATNMLVTVVTYYTVTGNGLVPVEHVRTPAGWQPVSLAGE